MIRKINREAIFISFLATLLIPSFLVGCVFGANKGPDRLEAARDAIYSQDYKLAKRSAKAVLKGEPNNAEAKVILEYIIYEDDILLGAFWENDAYAMRYLAPLVRDVNREDSRFGAPVLVLCAAWGNTEMVQILLESGADPNYGSDKDGYTALMWACKNFDEQLDMVRVLLEAGADIHARSNYDETPLIIAEEYGNPNIVLLIHEYDTKD